MRVCRRGESSVAGLILFIALLSSIVAFGQGSYTAQVRGTVADQTGAVVPGAKLTMTNDDTAIATLATTDSNGRYVFNGLRPASYT